jgi:hypothetical protein
MADSSTPDRYVDLPKGEQMKIDRTHSEVADWWWRAQRQTKTVWHSTRKDPIACIFRRSEKAPLFNGGLFRHLKSGAERSGKKGITKTR